MKRLPAVVALVLAGCASWATVGREATVLLGRADVLLARGDYTAALDGYDDLLRRHPDGAPATRARVTRSVITGLLAARDEMARLQQAMAADRDEIARLERELERTEFQIARLEGEVAARDTEISRARHALAGARQELVARQAQAAKLAAEADRLRNAVADLKRLDPDLERRR